MANTHSLDVELSTPSYAKLLSPDSAVILLQDTTIEAWIKPESLPGTACVMMCGGAGDGNDANNVVWGLLTRSDGDFTWFHEYAGGFNTLVDTTAGGHFTTGVWTHLAMVRDHSEQEIEFFVDGTSVQTVGYADDAVGGSTSDLWVGMDDNVSVPYDGLIDEVRVWNDVRTAAEISANYNKELVGDEAGLVGYWKFNNDYTDETVQSNDLSAVNSPVFSTDVPFVGAGAISKVNTIAYSAISKVATIAKANISKINTIAD